MYRNFSFYSIKLHQYFFLFLPFDNDCMFNPFNQFSLFTRFTNFTHTKHSPYFRRLSSFVNFNFSANTQAFPASFSTHSISFVHSKLYEAYVLHMIHMINFISSFSRFPHWYVNMFFYSKNYFFFF